MSLQSLALVLTTNLQQQRNETQKKTITERVQNGSNVQQKYIQRKTRQKPERGLVACCYPARKQNVPFLLMHPVVCEFHFSWIMLIVVCSRDWFITCLHTASREPHSCCWEHWAGNDKCRCQLLYVVIMTDTVWTVQVLFRDECAGWYCLNCTSVV